MTVACTSAVSVKVLVASSYKLYYSGKTILSSRASKKAEDVLEMTRLLNS